jgi:hypothetical protein
MKRIVASLVTAGCALVCLPLVAAAQCEGGPTITGMYGPGGVYVPAHCAYTNPTTPGQLYPSGAQPLPSTNPATGASALPGQRYLSGLLPVNNSDLGPAPSYVSSPSLAPGGLPVAGPNGGIATTTTSAIASTGLPGQFPQTGVPALTGNRAVPGALVGPLFDQPNLAYSFSLPAAPPRESPVPQLPADSDAVTLGYPNQ